MAYETSQEFPTASLDITPPPPPPPSSILGLTSSLPTTMIVPRATTLTPRCRWLFWGHLSHPLQSNSIEILNPQCQWVWHLSTLAGSRQPQQVGMKMYFSNCHQEKAPWHNGIDTQPDHQEDSGQWKNRASQSHTQTPSGTSFPPLPSTSRTPFLLLLLFYHLFLPWHIKILSCSGPGNSLTLTTY